ncbi:hypothetical protein F3Y22_tig00110674pilonHSYRG00052 [Hibiscus syriacus]|uniref:FAS1 domain-containing protein n=1 Tax=Hibiscus syriacus TaxID=106335 RepID=A0A6A2ZXB8_HIBSY|nr:hypothetical protein F3Y22_tig00110674pilonHSYRG00052 [Hibiscus syriacus]
MSTSLIFFFSILFVLLSTTHAFNITEILSRFSQFSTFNSHLTGTGLASQINNQKAVTVLVIANDQLRSFNYQAENDVRQILSFHVVLDYYDETSLRSLTSRTVLPTLYQGSTLTVNNDGGAITFRPSGANPNMDIKLLGTVESQPHSISVLQIAGIITLSGPSSAPSQQPPSAAPKASPPRKVLAPAPDPTPSTQAKKSPAPAPVPVWTPSRQSNNKTRKASPPSPTTKTKPSNNAPSPSKTISINAPASPPPPKTTSINAPPPSNSTSVNPPTDSPSPPESNSTTPPPVASPPTEAPVIPPSSDQEDNVPPPVAASTPKPSGGTPPPPATAAAVEAPAPTKSAAPALISSGNYLASIIVFLTTARFLFNMI